MLKKDNIVLGIIIGAILPLALYGLLLLIASLIEPAGIIGRALQPDKMLILALAFNVIPIRLYFVTYKFDRTGRGLLLSTFIIMVIYFVSIRYF